jgi:hypothetical protein
MASVESKEKEIIRDRLGKTKGGEIAGGADNGFVETATSQAKKRAMREELTQRWQDLGTPVEERVLILASILDSAPLTPALTSKYEMVLAKLASRMPIMQMLSRKQYIEYKLKLSQRPSGNGDSLSVTARTELTQELQDLVSNIETATKQYEIRYSERFVRPPTIMTNAGGSPTFSPVAASAPSTNGASTPSAARGFATDAGVSSTSSVISGRGNPRR